MVETGPPPNPFIVLSPLVLVFAVVELPVLYGIGKQRGFNVLASWALIGIAKVVTLGTLYFIALKFDNPPGMSFLQFWMYVLMGFSGYFALCFFLLKKMIPKERNLVVCLCLSAWLWLVLLLIPAFLRYFSPPMFQL